MKKLFPFLSLLLSLLLFCSCAGESVSKTGAAEDFTPLFRFQLQEGAADRTKLFYLSASRGFLYLHTTENGVTGGFVSPERSISAEKVFSEEAAATITAIAESEKDRAMILTQNSLSYALLSENGATKLDLPAGIDFTSAVFYDSLSVLAEKDGLILLLPVDFSETYVLAKKDLFPDFDRLCCTADHGKKIYYVRKTSADSYSGVGFFEYGKNVPLGKLDFTFHEFLPLGGGAVLFTTHLSEESTLYTYRNFETGDVFTLPVAERFDRVIATRDGAVFCGAKATVSGGEIEIFDLKNGEKKGNFSLSFGSPSGSLAIDDEGRTLLVALSSGTDEILGTLDLTSFF